MIFSLPTLCSHAETGHVDPLLIELYNTPGFVGCLSRVQFNRVAPLKSALRISAQAQTTTTAAQPDTQPAVASPVSYQGKLVESNCGASPLTISPMSAATNPWDLKDKGEHYSGYPSLYWTWFSPPASCFLLSFWRCVEFHWQTIMSLHICLLLLFSVLLTLFTSLVSSVIRSKNSWQVISGWSVLGVCAHMQGVLCL